MYEMYEDLIATLFSGSILSDIYNLHYVTIHGKVNLIINMFQDW